MRLFVLGGVGCVVGRFGLLDLLVEELLVFLVVRIDFLGPFFVHLNFIRGLGQGGHCVALVASPEFDKEARGAGQEQNQAGHGSHPHVLCQPLEGLRQPLQEGPECLSAPALVRVALTTGVGRHALLRFAFVAIYFSVARPAGAVGLDKDHVGQVNKTRDGSQ